MSYEVRFELCCLNPDCQNFKKKNSFVHGSCRGELYINRYGIINCRKCGTKFHILDGKSACGRCGNDINNNFALIIRSIALVASSYDGNIENFYDDLVNNICKKNRENIKR